MSAPKGKQLLFCNEYIVDLNATQAAIRAGYSERSARVTSSRMLAKANIQDKIAELMQERADNTKISAEWVLNSLKDVAGRCMVAEPVMVRGDNGMEPSGEYKFDSSGANRSLELIGRHLNLFTDKVDHTSSDGSMSPDKLSDDDLDKKIEELLKKTD